MLMMQVYISKARHRHSPAAFIFKHKVDTAVRDRNGLKPVFSINYGSWKVKMHMPVYPDVIDPVYAVGNVFFRKFMDSYFHRQCFLSKSLLTPAGITTWRRVLFFHNPFLIQKRSPGLKTP